MQGPCWKLFKKSIIDKHNILFPENMSYGEDAVFVYKYLKFTNSITAIDEYLYIYNMHDNESLSRVFRKDKYEIELLLSDKLKHLLDIHRVENNAFYYKQICGKYIEYIGGIWRTNIKFEKKIRYEYITSATSMLQTVEAFRFHSKISFQYRLLAYLITNNAVKRIDLYFRVKESMRNRLQFVFKLLRKT